jgi:hypothetical protein
LREKAHEIEVLIGNWQIAQRFILIFVQLTYWQKNFLYFFKKRLTSAAGYGIIGGPFASAAGPFCQLCKLYKIFQPNLCNLYTWQHSQIVLGPNVNKL